MKDRKYKGIEIHWDEEGTRKHGYADRGLAHWYIVLKESIGNKHRERNVYFHTLREIKEYIHNF